MGHEHTGRNGLRLIEAGATQKNTQDLAYFASSALRGANPHVTRAGRPVAPSQYIHEKDIFAGVVDLGKVRKIVSMDTRDEKPQICLEYIVPSRGNRQLSPVTENGPIEFTPRRTGHLSLVKRQ